MKTLKPTVYVIDDDKDIRNFLDVTLKGLGTKPESFATPEPFLKRLKESKPDLCLIDVNIGRAESGFLLVKAVRSVLGPRLPLLIVSSVRDRASIAHALEIGANDYIAKPIDTNALAMKLAQYLKSKELDEVSLKYVSAPGDGAPALIDLEFEISAIDEFGLRLRGKHLLSKGTVVKLVSPEITSITGQASGILVTVDSTWVEDGTEYGAYAEFDAANEELLRTVRRWLMARASVALPREV